MPPASIVTAVLLAAGSGARVGSGSPKQFLPLAGEPLVVHPLRVLDACPYVDSIILALPFDESLWPKEIDSFAKVAARTVGGDTRQASLVRALQHVPEETAVVMVHDAARPMLAVALIDSLMRGLEKGCEGVIPAIPLEDTIKRVSEQMLVTEQLDREGVWRVQTPQVFLKPALVDALAKAQHQGLVATDCSHLLTMAGYRVKVVPGDSQNFKVTRAEDLAWAESVMTGRSAVRPGGFSGGSS